MSLALDRDDGALALPLSSVREIYHAGKRFLDFFLSKGLPGLGLK